MQLASFPLLLMTLLSPPAPPHDDNPPKDLEPDALSQALLAPFKETLDPRRMNLDAESVRFKSADGISLQGWFFDLEGTDRTVLFCMGNTGNSTYMLPYVLPLRESGFDVFLFSYRGFGKSEGTISVSQLPTDVEAAYRYLTENRKIREQDLGVLGISLGSIFAFMLAANHSPAAIAVENAFLPSERLDAMAPPNLSLTERILLQTVKMAVLPHVEPLVLIHKIRCPVLLIHGTNDRLLPPSASIRLARASKVPTRTWILEDIGHAPQSLDRADWEYTYQLGSFFGEAFETQTLTTFETRRTTTKTEGGFVTVVDVTSSRSSGDERTPASAERVALEVCVGNDDHFSFARPWMVGGQHRVMFKTPFEPTHSSALIIDHTRDDGAGGWNADLSFLTASLLTCRQLNEELFERYRGEWKRTPTGWTQMLPPEAWPWLKKRLGQLGEIHPRIRPRYAKLLAGVAKGIQATNASFAEEAIEKMMTFVPEDPESYYELGNAFFQVGLQSRDIAWAAYSKALSDLETGRFQRAANALWVYRRVLPTVYVPLVSEEIVQNLDQHSSLPPVGTENRVLSRPLNR